MKLLLYTDNHFCESSSIIRKFGSVYSLRLENQLQSINWVQKEAERLSCDAIICLGDFFNTPELNEREITAVKDIKWSTIPNYFLVGNHESSINNLQFSSTKILETSNHFIISTPQKIQAEKSEVCLLPYVVESDRKPLIDYFGEKVCNRIILSHNDICGIQLGPIMSSTGFQKEDIESACDLFINGHLHNGKAITNKIINLGNLTGKDFGENALIYTHNIMLLDTNTLEITYIENPYAFNFYKLDINTEQDFLKLNNLKNNAVLSIKCNEKLIKDLKGALLNHQNIIESRIILVKDYSESEMTSELNLSDLTMDHLSKFIECCHEKLDNNAILEAELAEICK